MNLRPFRIAVPDADIADLHARLDRTRWPDEINDADWGWGTSLPWLRDLAQYWRHGFDWRAQEARLNTLPQFIATIDGQDIHFVHLRATGPNPLPLLLTHGWPGSFIEFEAIAPLLTAGAPCFDLVIPSLPGYGFSGRPAAPGMSPHAIGALWARLMAGLGYTRYGAQGGDWGAAVTTSVALAAPDAVIGIHQNMIIRMIPAPESPSPAERAYLAEIAHWADAEGAYGHIQATRPQTLGYALTDSPVGLAGWISEKFRVWSDCNGDPLNCFTRDQLLTNIAIYWFTANITSSLRLYKERLRASPALAPGQRVATPFGYAAFPKEIFRPPREFAERVYDVRRWTEMPRGGHFAAMEQPDLLAGEIKAFFQELR
ncbi:MAG: epoxide hydrolase [Acetobacteraceae bacterium]|nr:epoxide hydrolase [Acetobacteraceae bacterium]